MLPVSALNNIIKLCPKYLWENLASVNLKLKKLNYLLRVQPKIFCISVFNIGGCLASCLTIFNYRPLATWLLIKKRVVTYDISGKIYFINGKCLKMVTVFAEENAGIFNFHLNPFVPNALFPYPPQNRFSGAFRG